MASAIPHGFLHNGHLRTPLQFQPFRYSHLPTRSSIRLLSFVELQDRIGGVSFDGCPLIECVLDTVDLDDHPQYKALSYTWGNWQSTQFGQYDGYASSVRWPIIVNGQLLYITRNLHDALSQFGPYGYWDIERRFEPYDKTDLIRAAEDGQSQIVKRLILKGADLNAKDKFGETALHYAAENGHLTVVNLLLDYDAQTDQLDQSNRTPLDCCLQASQGQWEEVAAVLRNRPYSSNASHSEVTPEFPLKTKLWVDAICIDQTNLAERSFQVSMMARIYASTQATLIWLGVAQNDTQAAWEAFAYGFSETNEPRLQSTVLVPDYGWMATVMDSFFRRHWFTRKWVIQEMALPREIQLYCGRHEFDWDRISSVVFNFMSIGKFPTLDFLHYTSNLKYFWETNSQFTLFTLAHVRSRTQNDPDQDGRLLARQKLHPNRTDLSMSKLSLPVLLILTWRFASKDPRDRIYGLLGIAANVEDRPPIIPDYSVSVPKLFTEVGKIFVQAIGFHKIRNNTTGEEDDFEPLEGLSFVQGTFCGKHSSDPLHRSCEFTTLSRQLPSWIPDFDGLMSTERIYHDRFSASLDSKPGFYPSSEGSLTLDACCVDCIVDADNTPIKMKRPYTDPIRFFDPLTWLEMVSHLEPTTSTGQNRAEALWRTLTINNVVKDPEHAKSSFKKFICEDFAKHKMGFWKRKKYMQLLADLHNSDDSRSLPGPAEINNFCKVYDANTYDHKTPLEDPTSFHHTFAQFVRKRGLMRTRNGLLGLGPRWTQPGDEIWLLAGARTPFILRRQTAHGEIDSYRMIGEAYVHGVMYGELFTRQDVHFRPIELR